MKVMGKGSLASFLATLINMAWFLTAILLALSVCLLAVAPWVDPPAVEVGFALPTSFRLEPDTHAITSSPPDVTHVHLDKANGILRFSPRSRVVVAEGAVFLMAWLALALWVLGQLRALFCTLRAGRPFVSANATRIRRIAYAVIGAEIAGSVLSYASTRYVASHFVLEGVHLDTSLDVNVVAIVYGLIILVIAEVFREGTRLDEDQSLTI